VATSSIDDDLHGTTVDARLGVEDMASLIFVLLVLKCQDLGDNDSGARIIVTKDLVIFNFIHLPVHGHMLKGFHSLFTHGVECAIIVGNHGALVVALECLVALASTCEASNGTRLDGLIGWCR
jgi:hypothetical protein